MTSGVYPRKPGSNVGSKPMFGDADVLEILEWRNRGRSTKWIAAYFYTSEKTIQHVLAGTHAYKDMK